MADPLRTLRSRDKGERPPGILSILRRAAKGVASLSLAGALHASPPAVKWGHYAYAQSPSSDLTVVGIYRDTGRKVRLRTAAAQAFKNMTAAARGEGVEIIPISGFRSIDYQRGLFSRAVKRYGSEKKAARWVAPPGYSEHATGYALDLGDGSRRVNDVETSFAETPAALWLRDNGVRFGFELSFPENNPQGVHCEPWHWRFVGDAASRKVFSRARQHP